MDGEVKKPINQGERPDFGRFTQVLTISTEIGGFE